MIFKQDILKEEKIKFGIVMSAVTIHIALMIVLGFLYRSEWIPLVALTLIFLPIYLLMLLIGFNNLEYFCIYDDHIDVRTIYGIKNSVYYDNVLFVEEAGISLTTRGPKKTFYIFNDGRKNNGNAFDLNSCYNKKRYNLRIYKTKELESFIKNTLKIAVVINEE
jgi:hypothetical protein